MPRYLIEIENSTITTYDVEASSEEQAKRLVRDGRYSEVMEEHEQERIKTCEEIES